MDVVKRIFDVNKVKKCICCCSSVHLSGLSLRNKAVRNCIKSKRFSSDSTESMFVLKRKLTVEFVVQAFAANSKCKVLSIMNLN